MLAWPEVLVTGSFEDERISGGEFGTWSFEVDILGQVKLRIIL